MSDKKYIGNGTLREQYGILNFSVCLSDISKDDIFEYNGKKYVRLSAGPKREVSYGKTHSVWIDEYKPNEGATGTAKSTPKVNSLEEEDLPF